MITEAVQEKLAAVLTNCYAQIAPESATAPFILHIERGEPIRMKGPQGLVGYDYEVTVILVASDPASRETYTSSIIAALEAMSGNTIKNTQIDEVFYLSDTPLYDEETDLYGTNILFNIISTNR
jgi:hypothetical protein